MKIGLISCEIQIVSDKVIHCSVNESLSTSDRQLPVTVSPGASALWAQAQGSLCKPGRARGGGTLPPWEGDKAPRLAARCWDAGAACAEAAPSHGEGLTTPHHGQ